MNNFAPYEGLRMVLMTKRAAMAHERRAYNIPDGVMLGRVPYTILIQAYGCTGYTAFHSVKDLRRWLGGLTIRFERYHQNGVRTGRVAGKGAAMSVTIFEVTEKGTSIVRQGCNLRVIMDHARRFGLGGTYIWQDGYYLRVAFPDGSYCTTAFADPTVLRDWISDRVKYGRGRFIEGAPK